MTGQYEFTSIIREHLVTEPVEVPNHRLDERGWLARRLGRRVFRFRYLPMLVQTKIRQRFKAKGEVSGEEELALYNAQLRLTRSKATPEDIKLLQKDADRWNDSETLAATYAAVIVKPKMSEREVREFLETLDYKDMGVWLERTAKYLHVTEEDQRTLKNLSGPRTSSTSTTISKATVESSGTNGRGRRQRSTKWS
jgi:hypothetical protein